MISLADNSNYDWANVAVSVRKIQTPEAVDFTKENGICCNGELSVEMISKFCPKSKQQPTNKQYGC